MAVDSGLGGACGCAGGPARLFRNLRATKTPDELVGRQLEKLTCFAIWCAEAARGFESPRLATLLEKFFFFPAGWKHPCLQEVGRRVGSWHSELDVEVCATVLSSVGLYT